MLVSSTLKIIATLIPWHKEDYKTIKVFIAVMELPYFICMLWGSVRVFGE